MYRREASKGFVDFWGRSPSRDVRSTASMNTHIIFVWHYFGSPFRPKKISFLLQLWPFFFLIISSLYIIFFFYFTPSTIIISISSALKGICRRKKSEKSKTGEIYWFLNGIPTRVLTPWNARNPFNRFHMRVKPLPQLSGNYIECEPFGIDFCVLQVTIKVRSTNEKRYQCFFQTSVCVT